MFINSPLVPCLSVVREGAPHWPKSAEYNQSPLHEQQKCRPGGQRTEILGVLSVSNECNKNMRQFGVAHEI